MIRAASNSLVGRHFVAKRSTARVILRAPSASCDWKTENEQQQQQQKQEWQQVQRVWISNGANANARTPIAPQRRFLSTTESSSPQATEQSVGNSSEIGKHLEDKFENTMDNLFINSQKVAATEGDKWFVDEALTQEAWDPKWWNLADQAVNAVNLVDNLTGIGYAGSILAVTVTLRACIFPLAVRGQRASSRMAHLQPELAAMKNRYEALGTPTQAEQKAFAESMKGLFKRYEVTPFAALATPLIQAPIFIGMFFGMKKIPDLFPEMCANGGMWWFTDLTVPDPTYVLPLACGLSFIATIEAGKEQMIDSNPQHGPVIVNVFRAMAVVMVPVITSFPAAMLCYWVPNNFLTMIQSMVLRNEKVKQHFGIWDRPKPVPGQTPDAGFQETMTNLVKQVKGEPTTEKEKIEQHNKDIENRKRVQQASKAARDSRRR